MASSHNVLDEMSFFLRVHAETRVVLALIKIVPKSFVRSKSTRLNFGGRLVALQNQAVDFFKFSVSAITSPA